jgi:hypothetical protein
MTTILSLPESARAWRTAAFPQILKSELERLGLEELPLQQGLSASSVALDDELQVVVLSTMEDDGMIRGHAGLFYTGVVAGCNCADDPTPMDRENEYCEIEICIERATAQATITICAE